MADHVRADAIQRGAHGLGKVWQPLLGGAWMLLQPLHLKLPGSGERKVFEAQFREHLASKYAARYKRDKGDLAIEFQDLKSLGGRKFCVDAWAYVPKSADDNVAQGPFQAHFDAALC